MPYPGKLSLVRVLPLEGRVWCGKCSTYTPNSGCCLLQESAAVCYASGGSSPRASMGYYSGVWHGVPMGDVGQHTLL